MKANKGLLVALSLLMLTGMRDPFRQPEDRCHSAELTQWRYQGMVSKGQRNIGLLQDGQHRWRRVEQNQVLDNGWTIGQLTVQTLSVMTGKECDPPQWQWQRQGGVDETMDTDGAADRPAHGSGRKSTKHNAGAG